MEEPAGILMRQIFKRDMFDCACEAASCKLAILAAPAISRLTVSEVARDCAGLHAAQNCLCVICCVHV